MKKNILILSIYIIFGCFLWNASAVSARAGSGTCGDSVWNVDEDKVLTLSLAADHTTTSISEMDLWYITETFNKVVLESGYESIGDRAFSNCLNLTQITIPDSVTTIGSNAFYQCENLTDITLPDSVTAIGESAFINCMNLKSVKLSANLKTLGNNVFKGCSSLGNISIPSGVSQIPASAFYNCKKLKAVDISEGLTFIANYAFYNCENLTSIVLPSTVTRFGMVAVFGGCKRLSKVKLHDKLKDQITSVIPDGCSLSFYDCVSSAEDFKNPRAELLKTAGTCTKGATYYYECSQCHKKRSTTYSVEASGHTGRRNPTETFLKEEATCTSPAVYYYQCENCGVKLAKTYVWGQAKGHSPQENPSSQFLICQATCTAPAAYYYQCEICGLKLSERYLYGKLAPHSEETVIVPATVKQDGSLVKKCSKCFKVLDTATIPRAYITVKDTVTYTGEAVKPTVKVTDIYGNAILKSNYVVNYSNNIKPGKATVRITFKDNYSGTERKTFTIVNKANIPGKVKNLKVRGVSKAIRISWSKATAPASGYEIQYSTDKNFLRNVKTLKITMRDTISKKIVKLKANSIYYVRMRTYNKVANNIAYSAWTDGAKVKTK